MGKWRGNTSSLRCNILYWQFCYISGSFDKRDDASRCGPMKGLCPPHTALMLPSALPRLLLCASLNGLRICPRPPCRKSQLCKRYTKARFPKPFFIKLANIFPLEQCAFSTTPLTPASHTRPFGRATQKRQIFADQLGH